MAQERLSRRFLNLAANCIAYIKGDARFNHVDATHYDAAVWFFAYGYFLAERKNIWISNNPEEFADYISNEFNIKSQKFIWE